MADDHRETQDWFAPAAALAVWAAHFALLWTASSVFPGQMAARWIAAALTALALAALFLLWRRRKVETLFSAPGLGLAIAAAAVLYGAMPAAIG